MIVRWILLEKENDPVLSLVFFQKILTINNRFELNEKGRISYDCNSVNAITDRVVCEIQVNNIDEIFRVRIVWHGHKSY